MMPGVKGTHAFLHYCPAAARIIFNLTDICDQSALLSRQCDVLVAFQMYQTPQKADPVEHIEQKSIQKFGRGSRESFKVPLSRMRCLESVLPPLSESSSRGFDECFQRLR